MDYCGTVTNLELCLQPDGKTPKPGCELVDCIDEAAPHHNLHYSQQHSQCEHVQVGNKLMIYVIMAINKPTCRECRTCHHFTNFEI